MNPVRLGIIGCGGMSRHHGKQFTTSVTGTTIVALCDTHPANLARYQTEVFDPVQQQPVQFADHRDMLAKTALDAVMIVTPHTHHFQQTMDALAAGCHVLLEKPMVTSVEQARALVAQATKSGLIVSLAFPGPFCPEFAYVRELVTSGQLGDVLQLQGLVSQNWQQLTTGTWRQDPRLSGGGQAYDSGAHMFNALLYLSDQRPVEVFAWSDNRGTPVDINTVATIRFANGALGSAFVGGADVSGWQSGVFLSATNGSIKTGTHMGPVEHWDAKGRKVEPVLPPAQSLQQNFVDCIRGTAQTPCPTVWGLRQALLMEALYESIRTGQPSRVQPE